VQVGEVDQREETRALRERLDKLDVS